MLLPWWTSPAGLTGAEREAADSQRAAARTHKRLISMSLCFGICEMSSKPLYSGSSACTAMICESTTMCQAFSLEASYHLMLPMNKVFSDLLLRRLASISRLHLAHQDLLAAEALSEGAFYRRSTLQLWAIS